MCTVKNVIECIARPLTHICNQSLQTGVFPNNMKTAKVIPIHKTGDKHIGPYLASGACDLVTGACVVASLQLAQSVLFPPPPLAGKLGIDHAPQGAVRRKEEACSGANGILPFLNTIALLTRKYLV